MKLFFALVCALAIPMVVNAAEQDNPKNKKKGEGEAQHHQQVHAAKQGKGGAPHGSAVHAQGQVQHHQVKGDLQKNNALHAQGQAQLHQQNLKNSHANKLQANQLPAVQKGFKGKAQVKHFNLANKPNPQIQSVKFQANHHIEGSEHWSGQKYVVFKNYQSQWHDHDWWHHHHNRIILVSGGYYYWNAGFWFPAWGYDNAYSYYPYDGPIYAPHNLPPDQVIANVQTALQEQGFYHGEVDGQLGPLTRAALADYQNAQGLTTTEAVDQPTLESLGLT